MNYAETLILRYKSRKRVKKYNNLKFKVRGKDKIDNKNNYCDLNIQSSLKYFSPDNQFSNHNKEDYYIRKKIWKNQFLLDKECVKSS